MPPARSRRPLAIPKLGISFIAAQLGGGLLGFVLWAILSHSDGSSSERGAEILTLGMIVYLPLSLGLPFLLPNLYRRDGEAPATSRTVLRIIVVASSLAATCGTAIVIKSGDLNPWGAALVFAALICTSSTLQQIARLRRRLGEMCVGSFYNAALPGSSLLVYELGLRPALVVPMLLAPTGIVAGLLLREARRLDRREGGVPLRSVLGPAAVLVPHMAAFAVLAQGLRVPYSMADLPMMAPHAIMLFVGVALSVVMGVNSLLAVDIQISPGPQLRKNVTRAATVYVALGLAGFAGMLLVYATPLRGMLSGSQPLPIVALIVVCLVPGIFCLYFLGAALVLRQGSTWRLTCISVPCAVAYVAVSREYALSGATLEAQILVYGCALALMAGGSLFNGLGVNPLSSRIGGQSEALRPRTFKSAATIDPRNSESSDPIASRRSG